MRFLSIVCLLCLASSAVAQQSPPAGSSPAPASAEPSSPAAASPQDAGAAAVSVPIYPNSTCPIMGKAISRKLYTDTDFGRIYICCKSCIKKIKADVETAYKSSYPTTKKAANTICPVSGDKIASDSPTVLLQGYEIAVCCDDCIPIAKAHAQVTLVKALNPKVVDLDNKTCPINGEPVADHTFCLVGDTMIRLAQPACVDAVKKDPDGTVARAKELKSKEPASKAK